jgi:hypothetical protein
MARKLVFALSLVAAIAVVVGCKEEPKTSVNFDPKAGGYKGSEQYKQNVGTGTTATTTTKE